MRPPRVMVLRGKTPISQTSRKIIEYFHQVGHIVIEKDASKNAIKEIKVDLFVLTNDLEYLQALQLTERIRDKNMIIPIIVIRPDTGMTTKGAFFRAGIDDYYEVPVCFIEMNYRMQSLLRRAMISHEAEKIRFLSNELAFDFSNQWISLKGAKPKRLSPKAAMLLRYFWENPNVLLERRTVLLNVWGNDDYFVGRSMDVIISGIRKILSETSVSIETIHGQGFIFNLK